ncbi:MAG: propanediol utilization protein [Alphaproteobacteria bacterium]|nr:propanediol utilization protein [Alphaproteobacteria bacterium]
MRAEGPIFLPCHFGEWLQGRLGPQGPLALVTLMPKGVALTAWRHPARALACHAIGYGALPPAVLVRFGRTLGPVQSRTFLRLPYPPGMGTGMSTAGLLAAAGVGFAPEVLARACIAAEGASDPLMYPLPARLLWAPRLGQVLGELPPQPRAHLLAGFWGPPRPTRAGDQDYDDISDLVTAWQAGGDLAHFAALASESARRCLARRGPVGDPTEALACDLGALGFAISHSGAARALIFRPGQVPPQAVARLREAGLRGVHQLATCGA